MKRGVWWFVLPLVLVSSRTNADIESQTITLDLEKATVSPGAPTINIRANPSVVLEIRPSACNCEILPAYAGVRKSNIAIGAHEAEELTKVFGADFNLLSSTQIMIAQEKKGGDPSLAAILASLEEKTRPSEASSVALNFVHGRIRAAEKQDLDGHLWTVTLSGQREDYTVEVTLKGGPQKECGDVGRRYYVVIHVDSAPYELNWSGGFAVSSLRDDRIRLDPADQPDKLKVAPNGHGGLPSNLIAMAHYCYTKPALNWLCLSTGLGTDLPSTGLLLLAGPSLRLRPIQRANSFYLTAGAIYGQHKVLNDDYAGRLNPTVPSGTSSISLLTNRYTVGVAVGLSYGFIDAQDKFKSVYSKTGSSSEPAAKGAEPAKTPASPARTNPAPSLTPKPQPTPGAGGS